VFVTLTVSYKLLFIERSGQNFPKNTLDKLHHCNICTFSINCKLFKL